MKRNENREERERSAAEKGSRCRSGRKWTSDTAGPGGEDGEDGGGRAGWTAPAMAATATATVDRRLLTLDSEHRLFRKRRNTDDGQFVGFHGTSAHCATWRIQQKKTNKQTSC